MTGPALPIAAEPVPCLEEHCPAPCCDLHEVPLLFADVARLVAATGRPADSFVDEADGWLLLRGAGVADDGCVFKTAGHDGKGCSVHTARPAACRTYPFVLSDDGIARRDGHCPHASDFIAPPTVTEDLVRLQATLEAECTVRIEASP